MEIRNATRDDIGKAVDQANRLDGFEGNITVDYGTQTRKDGTGWRVKFGVVSSRGPGGRLSAGGISPQRRVAALCWHGFRDVLTRLFEIRPDAIVKTAFVTYRGRDGFEADFPSTYYKNAGSMMYPSDYGSLCDHDGDCVDDGIERTLRPLERADLGFLETGPGEPMSTYSPSL